MDHNEVMVKDHSGNPLTLHLNYNNGPVMCGLNTFYLHQEPSSITENRTQEGIKTKLGIYGPSYGNDVGSIENTSTTNFRPLVYGDPGP